MTNNEKKIEMNSKLFTLDEKRKELDKKEKEIKTKIDEYNNKVENYRSDSKNSFMCVLISIGLEILVFRQVPVGYIKTLIEFLPIISGVLSFNNFINYYKTACAYQFLIDNKNVELSNAHCEINEIKKLVGLVKDKMRDLTEENYLDEVNTLLDENMYTMNLNQPVTEEVKTRSLKQH